MIRSLALPVLALVSSPWIAGCAHARLPAAAAASHERPLPPMTLAYRVLRSGDGEGTVLAGRTDLERDGRGALLKAVAPHNGAEAEMDVTARDTESGDTILRVSYQERGPEGSSIKWEPEMRVVRGVPVRAEATGNGWTRTLEVTAE